MSFCGNLEDWQNPCKGVGSEENVAELTSMRNIGKEMANKLTSVGIDSPEKLIVAGAGCTMRYMLDTNICIYAIKQKPEAVIRRFLLHDARLACRPGGKFPHVGLCIKTSPPVVGQGTM